MALEVYLKQNSQRHTLLAENYLGDFYKKQKLPEIKHEFFRNN